MDKRYGPMIATCTSSSVEVDPTNKSAWNRDHCKKSLRKLRPMLVVATCTPADCGFTFISHAVARLVRVPKDRFFSAIYDHHYARILEKERTRSC
jgi:predicted Zn-ribbon and HTH transcriptional regulator